MPERPSYETAGVVRELLETLESLDTRFFEGPNALGDDQSVLEGYKWIFSILQVALDVQVWADPANPRFVDIVGPYKKWGGDNADAYYMHAPIDPDVTYRVRGKRGDAVVPVADRVRRAARRALLGADRRHRQRSRPPRHRRRRLVRADAGAGSADGLGRPVPAARGRRGRRDHPRLPRGPVPRSAVQLAHRVDRPTRHGPLDRRRSRAPVPGRAHLDRATGRHGAARAR